MTVAALERAIRPGDRILLDSSVLIAHLDGTERVSPLATHVIDTCVRHGRNDAVVSAVSISEILVGPLRLPTLEPGQHVRDFLRRTPHLSCGVVDFDVAANAAGLRAAHGLSAPDALIVATGQVHQVAHLVCNDRTWKKKLSLLATRFTVQCLSDFLN